MKTTETREHYTSETEWENDNIEFIKKYYPIWYNSALESVRYCRAAFQDSMADHYQKRADHYQQVLKAIANEKH